MVILQTVCIQCASRTFHTYPISSTIVVSFSAFKSNPKTRNANYSENQQTYFMKDTIGLFCILVYQVIMKELKTCYSSRTLTTSQKIAEWKSSMCISRASCPLNWANISLGNGNTFLKTKKD